MSRRDALTAVAALSLGARIHAAPAMTFLQLQIGEHLIGIDLESSPTTRDLLSLLPLSLAWEDYAATEKIAYLPRKLVTTQAPTGVQPQAGDLAYYAPWGNLALFHQDFRYSAGLIRLGRIRGGMTLVARGGAFNGRLALATSPGTASGRPTVAGP